MRHSHGRYLGIATYTTFLICTNPAENCWIEESSAPQRSTLTQIISNAFY